MTLEKVARQYRAEGYEVQVEPRGDDLPEFLRGSKPDLIARKGRENVVVGVTTRAALRRGDDVAFLLARVNSEPGWRFDLVLSDPRPWADRVADGAEEPDVKEIRARMGAVERLSDLGFVDAACLTAWALVEAATRRAAERLGLSLKFKDADYLIQALYSRGALSRQEYGRLRKLMEVRNAVAHGLKVPDLGPKVPAQMVALSDRMLRIAEAVRAR